jgi:ribosomal-protein-alanine N-acetyltransferase
LHEVRPGKPSDLAVIAAIQAASPEASQWKVTEDSPGEVRVAVAAGAVAGFLVGRRLGEAESEILNLAVAPPFRRKGVAATLVRAWIETVPGDVFLEVRESNAAARALYQSLHFVEVARREAYYSTPPEAAIVLKFHSC